MANRLRTLISATLVAALVLLPGCAAPGESAALGAADSGPGWVDKTTDTRSHELDTAEARVDFLGEYVALCSDVTDTAFHIRYQDNGSPPVPGPSDWRLAAVIKVDPRDIPLWLDGMDRALGHEIDLAWWDGLNCPGITLPADSWDVYSDCYSRDGGTFAVALEGQGAILLYSSSGHIPLTAQPDHEEALAGYDSYKPLVAKALGYSLSAGSHIHAAQAETVALEGGGTAAVVLYEALFFGSSIYHYPALAVDTGDGRPQCVPLGWGAYDGQLMLADIDGDGYDEVIAHHCIGGLGGAGSYGAQIYKLTDRGLELMWAWPEYDRPDAAEWDTGFTLALADGWLYTVANPGTGFSLTFERLPPYGESLCFDENGDLWPDGSYTGVQPLWADSFYELVPRDIDGDGVWELITAQYTCLEGHADALGDALAVLRWDSARGCMAVVAAGFWPYNQEDDGLRQAYFDSFWAP